MAKHRSPSLPDPAPDPARRAAPPLGASITFDPWSRHYVRLATQSGLEAWLLTWLPGQGTEWHDHGGSAGAFLTVRGALTERQAMVQRDGPPRVRPEVRTIRNGMLRPFGTKHVHRVTHEGPRRRSACTRTPPRWWR